MQIKCPVKLHVVGQVCPSNSLLLGKQTGHKNTRTNQPGQKTTKTALKKGLNLIQTLNIEKTPQVGLEPTAYRLTAGCSAIELLRIIFGAFYDHAFSAHFFIIYKKDLL